MPQLSYCIFLSISVWIIIIIRVFVIMAIIDDMAIPRFIIIVFLWLSFFF